MGKSTKARKGKESIGRRRKGSQECELQGEKKQQSWAVMKNILTCKHLQVEPSAAAAATHKHKHLQPQPDDDTRIIHVNRMRSSKKMRCSGSLSLSLCNNTNTNNPNLNTNTNTHTHTQRERRPTPATHHLQQSAATTTTNNNSPPPHPPPPPPPPDQLYSRKGSASSSSSFSIISGSSSTSNRSLVSTTPSLNKTTKIKIKRVPSSSTSASKGLPFRKLSLSGCSECTTVAVDPLLAGLTRDPSLRSTISSCPHCGDIFMKPDLLQLHQATKHAVSELGPEDTSRNIVEIIFQSSWLKKEAPVCKIDRILKVHNTSTTVSRFEEYRDLIKGKATGSSLPARCIADGNELLRFHCTTLMCSLGLHGSSNLCNSSPSCSVCGIIRDGFRARSAGGGILTTATSGRAHDQAEAAELLTVTTPSCRKAMLVCRVIAGRVNKGVPELDDGSYDSVAGVGGGPGPVFSDLDELYVYNPKAILPCFVVIYTL